jgi:hypothetical protein
LQTHRSRRHEPRDKIATPLRNVLSGWIKLWLFDYLPICFGFLTLAVNPEKNKGCLNCKLTT